MRSPQSTPTPATPGFTGAGVRANASILFRQRKPTCRPFLPKGSANGRRRESTATLRLLYEWVIDLGRRDDNPTWGLRVKRGQNLPTKPLTQNEVGRLLRACTRERDRLLILMLVHTGARIS